MHLFIPANYSGTWKIFTGNEIGLILGWWSLLKHKEQHPEMYPGTILHFDFYSTVMSSICFICQCVV